MTQINNCYIEKSKQLDLKANNIISELDNLFENKTSIFYDYDLKTMIAKHKAFAKDARKNQLKFNNLAKKLDPIMDNIDEKLKKFEDDETTDKKKKFGRSKKGISYVTRRIRIYPTQKQKEYFKKCIDTSRYMYNNGIKFVNNLIEERQRKITNNLNNGCIYHKSKKQCCEIIDENNKYFCTKHQSEKYDKSRWEEYRINTSFINIRKNVMKNDQDLTKDELWQLEVPYDTRQLILKDVENAYNSALSNYMAGNITHFKLGYKKRGDRDKIFNIGKRAINKNLEMFKQKKVGKLRTRNKMMRWINKNIDKIESDCKIIRYGGGDYYLLLSIENTVKKNQESIPFDIGIIDPGTETFATIYSPNGMVIEVGKNFAKKELIPIENQIDKLKSVSSKVKNGTIKVKNKKRTMRNIRNRNFRSRNKIQNKVRDMQWKTVNMLTENFKTVVTTTFGVKNMVNKAKRKINSDTVREMQLLSFDKFKRKLIDRGERRECEIKIVDEEYTSKTCGNCGILGIPDRDRILRCKGCGKKMNRDINGARNILIKIITEGIMKVQEERKQEHKNKK